MRLPFDPFLRFVDGISPFDIHIRMSVLKENTEELDYLRRQYLENLYDAQKRDGSWGESIVRTIDALFVMKLFEPEPSRSMELGIEYLLEGPIQILPEDPGKRGKYAGLFRKMAPEDRAELRSRGDIFLHNGSTIFAKTGAVLFLSADTPLEGDPRIVQAFRQLDRTFQENGKSWGALASSNNILLAYAAHPLKKSSRTTRLALGHLERQQLKSGGWKGLSATAKVIYVLSHSTLPSAVRQLDRAFRWLVDNQNEDGTWGNKDREFAGFLILEGLARRGYSTKRQGLKRYVDLHKKRLAPAVKRPSAQVEERTLGSD